MSNRRRRGSIRQENEARIKQAAEMLFSEQGFRGASIGMIAESAGVPKPNVYYYFGTKEELYQAVIEDICATWLRAGDSFDEGADPAQAVRAYVMAKMDLARTRPHASRLWATEIARGAPVIKSYLEETVRPWIEVKEKVLSVWIERGLMAPVDARTFFFMIWATTQHYADFEAQVTVLNGDREMTEEEFKQTKRMVSDLILRSVKLKP